MTEREYVDEALKRIGVDNSPSRIRDLLLPGIRGAHSVGLPVEELAEEWKPRVQKMRDKWATE